MNIWKRAYEGSCPRLRYTPLREATKNLVRVFATACRTCSLGRACGDPNPIHVRPALFTPEV